MHCERDGVVDLKAAPIIQAYWALTCCLCVQCCSQLKLEEITPLAVQLAVGASCCPAFHRLALQQFTGMLCSAALYSATAAAAFQALLLCSGIGASR